MFTAPVIEVTFEIDASGILSVKAEQQTTKVSQTITVIQNKNESNVEVSYNRDNVNSVFTIPERSIVTVVDNIS